MSGMIFRELPAAPAELVNLTEHETARLAELEAILDRDLKAFQRAGIALAEIRESRLYRKTHSTFEAYCGERWSMSYRRAAQLMDAAETVQDLLNNCSETPPTHESQLRPLTGMNPEQKREAWVEATKDNPNPTAQQVEEAKQQVLEADEVARDVPSWEKNPPSKSVTNKRRGRKSAPHNSAIEEEERRERLEEEDADDRYDKTCAFGNLFQFDPIDREVEAFAKEFLNRIDWEQVKSDWAVPWFVGGPTDISAERLQRCAAVITAISELMT
jgi:hypothetical protein